MYGGCILYYARTQQAFLYVQGLKKPNNFCRDGIGVCFGDLTFTNPIASFLLKIISPKRIIGRIGVTTHPTPQLNLVNL